MRPSGHFVPGVSPEPHPRLHLAVDVQVTTQSPLHLMSQVEMSLHATVLPAPRLSLQLALLEQIAEERSPALSSHLEDATQVIRLPSPPFPLHSEVSLQVSIVGPVDRALHFAAVPQLNEHPVASHIALQSMPALQAHAFPGAHAHPAPVQVAVVD